MSDRILSAKITRGGMRAVFNATSTGLDLKLSHIAIGTGAGTGYVPNGNEVRLKNEFQRVAIGGGDYITNFEILVQALFDGAPVGWVHEVGIFDENGVLFALWSEINAPLAYKSNGVAMITALTLAVTEIPPNALTVVAGGASVNIILAEPFAQLSAEVLRLQRIAVQNETQKLTPSFNDRWR
jgi:hypothetical protein